MNIVSVNQDHTVEIAEAIAPLFKPGDIIILEGGLAAGKTYFVKGFANYYHNKEAVSSPTYSLANFYTGKRATLLHMDLYRIKSIEEFADLGIEEYFPDAIVLIEWGGMLFDHLDDYFLISLNFIEGNSEHRNISFSVKGEKYKNTLSRVDQVLAKFSVC